MLNDASLNLIRVKLLSGPNTLNPQECAFLASLLSHHVTGVQANELYLTPVPYEDLRTADEPAHRSSITQPMNPIVALLAQSQDWRDARLSDDFPQSLR